MSSEARWSGVLQTVTHARLRAEQGDVATARRILQAVLAERPGDPEAQEMLVLFRAAPGCEHRETKDEVPPPPEGARAEDLGARFKECLGTGATAPEGSVRRRLESMLRRIDEIREERGAR